MGFQRFVVLGGSGSLGSQVTEILAREGRDAIALSRRDGVDARTGQGLDDALAGADVVIDCLNFQTLSSRRARTFFDTVGHRVAGAAARAGVSRIVCLSIANTTEPRVRSALGYYAGKAAHEEAYRSCGVPVVIARTTQWYSLGRLLLQQLRFGRTAVVPRMRIRPVAPEAAARFVVACAQPGASDDYERRALCGPETMDTVELVRRLGRVEQPTTRIVAVPMPQRALRTGALVPGPEAVVDPVTLTDWLAQERS